MRTHQQRVVVGVALVAAVLAGCTSRPQPEATSTASPTTSSTTPTTVPSSPPAPPPADVDELGRPAAIGCAEGALECDVDFTVTAIQQGYDCDDTSLRPGPDEQWLRFDVVATARAEFAFTWSATALALNNWTIEGPDGKTPATTTMSNQCSTGRVPVLEPLTPGAHVTTGVVVVAPKPASVLRLDVDELSWQWRIA